MTIRHEPGSSRAVVGLLLLASVTVLTLDSRHDHASTPLDPLRTAVADVLGPVETGTSALVRPITRIPDHFAKVSDLQRANASLVQQNQQLREQLQLIGADRTRAEEVAGITRFADTSGDTVVQAQVVGMGAAQTFSRTVTIDRGTSSGIVPDLTVIDADGLVGRVVSADAATATVLLIADSQSTVGGRLGDSMELGFVTGDGEISSDGRLTLSLVDHTVDPKVGDTVVTWGSRHHAPYVPGVPIGTVVSVHSSPAELTQTAQVKPFADFSSLDVVGVVTSVSK